MDESQQYKIGFPEPEALSLLTPDDIYQLGDEELLQQIKEDRRIERKPSGYQPRALAEYFSMWANTAPDGGIVVIGLENDGVIKAGYSTLESGRRNELECTGNNFCPDARYETKVVRATRLDGQSDSLLVIRVYYRKDKVVRTTNEPQTGRHSDGGVKGLQPNVACALLFAQDPLIKFPGCKVRFLRFEGEFEKTGDAFNAVKDVTIEGPVPTLITQTEQVLDSQLRTFSKLGADGKFYKDQEYPKAAWYEAVVNACVHRSYNMKNMNIFVKMFDDRLVVESPGGFPPFVSPENIYETSHPRNPHLMNAMFQRWKLAKPWPRQNRLSELSNWQGTILCARTSERRPAYACAGRSSGCTGEARPGSGLSTCCTPSSGGVGGAARVGRSLPSRIRRMSLASITSRSSSAAAILPSASRWLVFRSTAILYAVSTRRRTS